MTLKTKQIQTGKATILAVELPKGVKEVKISGLNWLCEPSDDIGWYPFLKLPQGNWKPLWFADQLSEMELIDVVDERGGVYFDYENNQHIPYDFNKWVYFFFNRLDSFSSLLKANGVVVVNPYEKPDCDNCICDGMFIHECMEELNLYQQAESQLWENVFILVKI